MSDWKKVALAGLLLLAVVGAGCEDGDPVAVGVVGCGDSYTVTLDLSPTTYVEAPTEALPGCDPYVVSGYGTTAGALTVGVGWVFDTASGSFDNAFVTNLFGPAPTTLPATYTIVSGAVSPKAGEAQHYYYTPSLSCSAAGGGTVTLDAFGPVGTRTEGTISGVTYVEAGCPANASGSFSATREPDN